jgi:hypothetical protein
VQIIIGGNLIDYLYKLTTRTADIVSAEIMWNSVISSPGAKFGGTNIKNMYLKTSLDQYKYMGMPLKLFPDDIIGCYNTGHSPQQLFIHGDSMWHVRFTTSRHLGKQAPMAMPGSAWLL